MQETATNTEAAPATEHPDTFDAFVAQALNKPVAAPAAPAAPAEVKTEAKTEAKADTQQTPPPADKPVETSQKRTSVFASKPEAKETPKEGQEVDVLAGVKEGDWKAAKTAFKAREAALLKELNESKVYKAKLDEYHQKIPDAETTLKKVSEYDAMSARLAQLDYQNHPEFIKQFKDPQARIIADAKVILAENGIADDIDLARLAEKPRIEYAKAISEISEKLNEFDKAQFRDSMRDLQKVRTAEKQALANHQQGLANIGEQAKAKARVAFEQAYKDTAISSYTQKLDVPEAATPQEKESITTFNAALDQVRGMAEKYAFAASDERQVAEIATKAANLEFITQHLFPRMQAEYDKTLAERNEFEAQIKKLTAVQPKDGGDKGAPGNTAPQSFDDFVRQTIRM